MDLLYNFPLWAALAAIVFAQVVKIPIQFVATREFKPELAFSTGGMPSSHSAAVTAVTTSIGLQEGTGSAVFAASAVFSLIIMFDASGVRRQAGEQAIVLNMLVKDFGYFMEEAKGWGKKGDYQKKEELKELLGHQPIEVLIGGLTGIVLALIIYQLFPYQ